MEKLSKLPKANKEEVYFIIASLLTDGIILNNADIAISVIVNAAVQSRNELMWLDEATKAMESLTSFYNMLIEEIEKVETINHLTAKHIIVVYTDIDSVLYSIFKPIRSIRCGTVIEILRQYICGADLLHIAERINGYLYKDSRNTTK